MAILDADNDGMSDVWELRYGFHVDDVGTLYPDEAPGADPDHDGFTNLQEAIAGTNPWDFSSRPILRISEDVAANEVILRFNGIAGIRYQLQTSNVAQLGVWPWSSLGPQLLGDGNDIISRTTRPAQTGVTTYFRLMVLASVDSDGDGLSDWEEIQLGTDKTKTDTDGDGVSDLDELRNGTDPRDFYNGQTPQLEILSGNQQTAEPDGRFNQPLRVRVRSATAPNQVLANAPVTFVFRTGAGAVLPASNVRTGADGIAEARCETTSELGATLEVGVVAAPVGAASASSSYSLMAPTESLSGALEAWIVSPHRVALAWSGVNVSSCLLEHRHGVSGNWETERQITTTSGETLAAISSASEVASYRLRALSQIAQIIADTPPASMHPVPSGLVAVPMASSVEKFNSRGQFGYVGLDGVFAQAWDGSRWQALPGDASAVKTVNAVNEAGDLAGSVLKHAVIWQWNAQAGSYTQSMVPGLGEYDESFPEHYWRDGSLQGRVIKIEQRPIYRTIDHVYGYLWDDPDNTWIDQGEIQNPSESEIRARLGFGLGTYRYSLAPLILYRYQNIDTNAYYTSLPDDATAIWWPEANFESPLPSGFHVGIRIGTTQNYPERIRIGTENVRRISYFLHAPGNQGTAISTQPINEPTASEPIQALNDLGDQVILSSGYYLRVQTTDGAIIPLTGLPNSSRVFALSHQRQVGGGAFDANYSYEPFLRFADDTNQLLPVPAPYEGSGGAVLAISRDGYAVGALALGEGGGLLGSQAAIWAPDGTYIDISTLLAVADPTLWLRRVTSINDSGMILCVSGESEADNPSQKRLLRPVKFTITSPGAFRALSQCDTAILEGTYTGAGIESVQKVEYLNGNMVVGESTQGPNWHAEWHNLPVGQWVGRTTEDRAAQREINGECFTIRIVARATLTDGTTVMSAPQAIRVLPVSRAAIEFIKSVEVDSNLLGRDAPPEWPGGASGVTIGVGYDLGMNSPDQIRRDWESLLPAATLDRLVMLAGFTGTRARDRLASVRDIVIPWSASNAVYENRTIPRFTSDTLAIYPEAAHLNPNITGALVSLVFNRGPGLTDRPGQRTRRHIRDIQAALRDGQVEQIPSILRDMATIWANSNIANGMVNRRGAEATFIEQALADPDNDPCN